MNKTLLLASELGGEPCRCAGAGVDSAADDDCCWASTPSLHGNMNSGVTDDDDDDDDDVTLCSPQYRLLLVIGLEQQISLAAPKFPT